MEQDNERKQIKQSGTFYVMALACTSHSCKSETLNTKTMLCPIKVNNNKIELNVHTSCNYVLDLHLETGYNQS